MRFYLLICFFANVACAQNDKDRHMVYITKPDEILKFQILNKSSDITPDNKLYYWYWMNDIHSTHQGFDGKLLHGDYSAFYESNNLKEKGQFKNGLKTGEWISWSESGNKRIVANWDKGVLSGKYEEYDLNGMLIKEFYYSKGELDGKQITYDKGRIDELKKFKKGKEILPEPLKEKSKSKEAMGKIDKSEVKSSFWMKATTFFKNQGSKIKGLFKSKKKENLPSDEKRKEEKVNELSKPKKMKPKDRDFH